MISKFLQILIVVLLICNVQHAQFSPDSTFNGNGVADYMQWTGGFKNGDRIAHTSDGSVIVGGRYDNRAAIWKYKQDGTLDETFGTDGAFYHALGTSYIPWAREVTVLEDGSILVLWQCEMFTTGDIAYTTSSILIAKLNADGTPDTGFGIDGVINTRPVAAYEYDPARMYIDMAHERIYVCGMSPEQGHYDCVIGTGAWFIAKFDLNTGALDNTFSDDGCLISTSQALRMAPTITPLAIIYDVKVTSGNKLFVTGMLHRLDSTIFTMRLNMDGTYDESFGTLGRKLVPVTDIDMHTSIRANYMRILEDNTVLLARYETITGTSLFRDSSVVRLLKINAAGARDWSFGGGGGSVQYKEVGSYPIITLDQTNNLLLTWYEVMSTDEQRIGFRKLLPNGMVNTAFGSAGIFFSTPLSPDTFMNPSDIRQVIYNTEFDEITLVGIRSKPTNPTTFRLLNFKLMKEQPSGIENAVNPALIGVFPNPASSYVQVQSSYHSNIKKITVYDVLGRSLITNDVNASEALVSVNNLASGHFYIKIYFEDNTSYFEKIVIQR